LRRKFGRRPKADLAPDVKTCRFFGSSFPLATERDTTRCAKSPPRGESDCLEFAPPDLTETAVFAPVLCPEWFDASPAADKRRAFSAEEKARIVAESFESGQSVCSVARKYQLKASQLFAWRKRARLQQEGLDRNIELLVSEPAAEE
jgi:Transposase